MSRRGLADGVRAPLVIAAIYFVFGFLWILLTDVFLVVLTEDPAEYVRLQTWKGSFYVLITAVMAWFLVRRFAMQQVAIQRELREQRDTLERTVKEKEKLIQEIHHRVKNNLQVILSIIRLASQDIPDPTAMRRIEKISARIHAISLVHETILASRYADAVPCEQYFPSLVRLLSDPFPSPRISWSTEIQPCTISTALAVPAALVMTELLSNVLDHAFPGERSGTVTLAVRSDDDFVVLEVIDDGVGGADGIDRSEREGKGSLKVGLKIARAMAQQLSGELKIVSGPEGTRATLRIPVPLPESASSIVTPALQNR